MLESRAAAAGASRRHSRVAQSPCGHTSKDRFDGDKTGDSGSDRLWELGEGSCARKGRWK